VLVRGESARGRASVVSELHARGPFAGAPLVRFEAGEGDAVPVAGAACLHLEDVERLSPQAQERWKERLAAPAAGAPRVLASTRHDLAALAGEGAFDAELATLLAHDEILLPTLRERPDDLRELVPALVRRLARIGGRHDVKVPAPVVTALRSFGWPGDLDQLVGVLELALRRARHGSVTLENVEAALDERDPGAETLRAARDRRQREELHALFEDCHGNLAEMARRLGVSRGSVVYRLKTLGLPPRAGGA
jgi:DNA-binding NtrC family response regulator